MFFVVGSCWWARRAHPLIGQAGERSNRWYEPPPSGPLRSVPASSLAFEQSASFRAPSRLQHRRRWWWGRRRRHHHHTRLAESAFTAPRTRHRPGHPLRVPATGPEYGQQRASSRRCWNDDRSSPSPGTPASTPTGTSRLPTGQSQQQLYTQARRWSKRTDRNPAVRRLRWPNSRKMAVARNGSVLAQQLPEMHVLRRGTRGNRPLVLHQERHDPLQKRLQKDVRKQRCLRGLRQRDTCQRVGDEGGWIGVSPEMLHLQQMRQSTRFRR